ncbi:MAG: hypothetical protein E3J56_01820 [Candidatus Aminicenantes bacterium]|nr:MAG: hypothetical protein E3J56_01820 [Candidatus Aminicenantes bacterium]
MEEFKTIALILIGIGLFIIIFSFQSKLLNPGETDFGWVQIGSIFFGIAAITTGIIILLKTKNSS